MSVTSIRNVDFVHLLLHDYANYAFTKQLASQLAALGVKVTYAYNAQ